MANEASEGTAFTAFALCTPGRAPGVRRRIVSAR